MFRPLLFLVIAGVVSVGDVVSIAGRACARPPDEVPHSPIPSLKPPAQRPAPQKPARESPQSADQNRAATAASDAPSYEGEGTSKNTAEQPDVWSSSQMREGRDYVAEFCRRSAQTSPEEGEQFLEKLSQLSPAQQRMWLKRLQARREAIARGRSLDNFSRQWSLQQTIARFEAKRRAAENEAELRNEAAAARPPTVLRSQPGNSWQLDPGQTFYTGPIFDPFAPTFDPASPSAYVRRAAAASLPGDLPRSDPRNYIRDNLQDNVDSPPEAPLVTPPPATSGGGEAPAGE